MRTFPPLPSLESDEYARLVPDSSGLSLVDASLDVGRRVFVTLNSADHVASDQRSLTAELDERRRQLTASRDEMWAPLDLASLVECYVPRSATAAGSFVIYSLLLFSHH